MIERNCGPVTDRGGPNGHNRAADDAAAQSGVALGRIELEIDGGAWQQSLESFYERAARRDVDHIDFVSRPDSGFDPGRWG
jgi:hypothetical protein